ncbi:MAG: hypothetical protein ABFD12_03115 [Syntrophorhabdus sp.]
MERLFEEHGISPVDQIIESQASREAILHDYVEAIGLLGEWNGDKSHWWITDISSKNAYRSPLIQHVIDLVDCIRALEFVNTERRALYVLGVSWPVILSLRNICADDGRKIIILSPAWTRYSARWSGKARAMAETIRSAACMLRDVLTAKKYYGGKKTAGVSKEPVYLIKSFTYPHSFDHSGAYDDPFFGNLALHLSQKLAGNIRVITVSLAPNAKKDCLRRMKDLKGRVIPIESMITCGDVAKSFFLLAGRLVCRPFRVKDTITFMERDITDLVREVLASGGWRIPFYQSIHYQAARNLAKTYHLAASVLTYENNPWERAFIDGLRKESPDVKIFGYQHSVIPQAAANMFQSARELSRIPCPDILITTGSVPAEIISKYGAFPKSRIRVSCGLRYNYLDSVKPVPRDKPESGDTMRVLVALCGVVQTISLVKYAVRQARDNPGFEFVIRPHPAMPFETIRSLVDVELPLNARVSTDRSVMEDILPCHVLLYWGSSVSLEAIRLGKPVIHFNPDDKLSFDPLFDLNDFRWVVNPADNLKDISCKIAQMSDVEFEEKRDKALRYISDYHKPVNDQNLFPFFDFKYDTASV